MASERMRESWSEYAGFSFAFVEEFVFEGVKKIDASNINTDCNCDERVKEILELSLVNANSPTRIGQKKCDPMLDSIAFMYTFTLLHISER